MSETNFEIELRGGEQEGAITRFYPGATLQGSVRITPKVDLSARQINIRLQWHTEGRGDRDQAVVAEELIRNGDLNAGVSSYHSFQFRLPDRPWSYAGHYINIIWEVEVAIDLPMARDPRATLAFVLAPER
jgi:hypothetical protein